MGTICLPPPAADLERIPARPGRERRAAMLDRFEIDHAALNWAVNRWITAPFRVFRPQVECLLVQRDRVIAEWMAPFPGEDVFEKCELETTGYLPINIDAFLSQLKTLESGH